MGAVEQLGAIGVPFAATCDLRAQTHPTLGVFATLGYRDAKGRTVVRALMHAEEIEAHAHDLLAMAAAMRGAESGEITALHSRPSRLTRPVGEGRG